MKVALFKHQITGLGGTERVILEYMKNSKNETVLFTDKLPSSISNWLHAYGIDKGRITELRNLNSCALFESLHPCVIKLPLDDVDAFIPFLGELLSEAIITRNKGVVSVAYIAGIFRFIDLLEQKMRLQTGKLLPLAKTYASISSAFLRNYSALVVNSNFIKCRLDNLVKLKGTNKISVVHPGVDTSVFKPTFLFNNYFLIVCRIEKLKNLELLINAFTIFCSLSKQKFRLVIAGYLKPSNYSYFNNLKKICNDRIEFVIDPTDIQLLRLYQESYAFVFTSYREPFGITPLEAMACGKPVIAAGEGGFLDYIIDGENGFVTPSSPIAIAKKMCLLVENQELLLRLGEQARKKALLFDWKEFTKQIDDILDSLNVG